MNKTLRVIKELEQLVEENPDLPIFAMVDGDVVGADDIYHSWIGEVTHVHKQKYAVNHYRDGEMLDEYDVETLIEDIIDCEFDGKGDDATYDLAEERAKSMFKEAIFIHVGSCCDYAE